MLKRYNRLLVAIHVAADMLAGVLAFGAAYVVRFKTGILSYPRGLPDFSEYLPLLPFIAVLVPLAFQVQGLYRLRRGRTRVDDFFAVLVGSVLAVIGGVTGTLYFRTYYLAGPLKQTGVLEVSRLVWALFLCFNVLFTFASREIVRDVFRRRWRAGRGLR